MLRGLALIALAATSWGTTGAVTALLSARAGADPLVVGAVRMWLAAVLLAAAARLVAGRVVPEPGHRRRVVVAGVAMAGFQATYFSAVLAAGIAVTALVAICSAPLLITGLAALWLDERPGRGVVAALGLGIAGTALLVAGPGLAVGASWRTTGGMLLALGAGLCYAVYVVVAKQSVGTTAPLPFAAAGFAVAAVTLTPALLWAEAPLRQIARGWAGMSYLGVVTTALAYALYTAGLRWVPASAAGIVALLEPLTATLLGMLLFDERLGSAGLAGGALLLAAIGLLLREQAA